MAANDTYSFGSGSLWTTQLTDYTGAAVTLPTPLLIGTLQDVSVDFAWDAKPLHGQNMAAIARSVQHEGADGGYDDDDDDGHRHSQYRTEIGRAIEGLDVR